MKKNSQSAIIFLELDQLYKKLNTPASQRLTNYESHLDIIRERDDVMLEYVTLLNLTGSYEKALLYPENLGEGRLEGTKDNHIHYYMGVIAERMDKFAEAAEHFRAALAIDGSHQNCKIYLESCS